MNSPRAVKRLFDMEIDEVSLVDRPANQHSSIAIAKAHREDDVPGIYDEEGYEVDPDSLSHGDVVFDDSGEALVFDETGEFDESHEPEPQGEFVGVGKSLGDVLVEELSKADSDEARDRVIAKAMNEVEVAKAAAAEAWQAAEAEREARFDEEFISKAAEYNLPVDPTVLGPILKSMAATLDPQQLEVIDQLFDAIGEDLYDEYGYEGGGDNASVLDSVEEYANEYVGKADVTGAQAITDVFASNPEAYDAYLSENGR